MPAIARDLCIPPVLTPRRQRRKFSCLRLLVTHHTFNHTFDTSLTFLESLESQLGDPCQEIGDWGPNDGYRRRLHRLEIPLA